MSHTFGNGGVVLDTPEDINRSRLLALAGALWLETKGMRHSKGSVYGMVKREFHLKGNKRKVFETFCTMHHLDEFKAKLERHPVGYNKDEVE